MLLPMNFRRPEPVDFDTPMQQYINANMGQAVWTQVQPYISELKSIRAEAMDCMSAINDNLRLEELDKRLKRYLAIEGKLMLGFSFGPGPNNIKINFVWHDSLLPKVSKASCNILFDKMSMMHNLIALNCTIAINYAKIAKHKEAYSRFQQAIAIMEKFTSELGSLPVQDYTQDFSMESINLYSNLLKGNSHISFIEFGKDKSADPKACEALAQRCIACSKDFGAAYLASQGPSLKKIFPEKDFKNVIKYNEVTYICEGYHFMAKKHAALVEATGKGIGLALGFMELGAEQFQLLDSFKKTLNQAVVVAIEKDKKQYDINYNKWDTENRKIYFETVEKERSKLLIEPKYPPPVKPFVEDEVSGFPAIVSVEGIKLMEEFKLYVDNEVINPFVQCCQQFEMEEVSFLKSYNLPERLYMSTQSNHLPDMLWEKIQRAKHLGGSDGINKAVQRLYSAAESNQQLLQMIENDLKQEEEDDAKLRQQYPQQTAQRPYSNAVNGMYKMTLKTLQDNLEKARKADSTITNTLQEISGDMKLLDQSRAQIEQSIPSSGGPDFSNNPAIKEVMAALDLIQKAKKDRNMAMEKIMELKSQEKPCIEFNNIAQGKMQKTEGFNALKAKYQAVIDSSKEQNRQHIFEMIATNIPKLDELTKNMGGQGSSQIIQRLDIAASKCEEISNNCAQGTKFYTDLSAHISRLKQTVADYILTRNMTKDESIPKSTPSPQQFPGFQPYNQGGFQPTQPPFQPQQYQPGQYQPGQPYGQPYQYQPKQFVPGPNNVGFQPYNPNNKPY